MNKMMIWGGTAMLAACVTVACGDDGEEPTTTGTTPTTTTTTTSSGMGGMATTTSTTSGMGGEGGGEASVNGCTFATAEDLTGNAAVTITDGGNDWTVPHQRCIVVDAGTEVTWVGNMTTHPLQGGVTGTPDATSPIGTVATGSDAVVNFDTVGDYPYYCTIHTTSMQGVVYVQ